MRHLGDAVFGFISMARECAQKFVEDGFDIALTVVSGHGRLSGSPFLMPSVVGTDVEGQCFERTPFRL